jgi:hypothetical protein
MAVKKCLICNKAFSGRRDAKTCSVRCRKRLQLVKLSVFSAPAKKHLAKTLTILAFSVFSILSIFFSAANHPTSAATSSYLNFQSRLLSSTGNVIPDGNYNIEFKIYKSLASGASAQGVCVGGVTDDCLWKETRTGGNQVRVVNGYMSVNLGSVTSFPAINWDQQLYLTMNIGGTGAASWDGEMSPRVTMTALPYAFRAGALAKTDGSGNVGTLSFNTTTNNPVITLPDATGTVCLQASSACGFLTSTTGVQLQGSTPGTPQTGNFNISGTGIAATALLTPSIDQATAGALGIANSTATAVNIGKAGSNITTTVTGLAVFKPSTGNDSATAFQIQNAAGSSILNADTTIGNISQTTFGAKYLGGEDAEGSTNTGISVGTQNDVVVAGRYAYVTQLGGGGTCSNAAGSAIGCELKVYDVSTPSSPVLIGGADASGTTNGGGGSKDFIYLYVSGHYAYVTTAGNATACSQTAGSAIGCELMIFDISNPSSPTYVGGADISGSTNSGTGNKKASRIIVSGQYAYIATDANSTACSQTAGSAIGCEIQVYDVSNPTVPKYIGGADVSGTTNGGTGLLEMKQIQVSGRYLYATTVGDTTPCSGTPGSAIGCDLQVYDVSNPATPIYKGGGDGSGNTNSGTGGGIAWAFAVQGRFAYIGRSGDATNCNTAGNKVGCEIQIWDISNPGGPIYKGGADNTGSANSGTGTTPSNPSSLAVSGRYLYSFRSGDATACSGSAGSAIGCELQIYDVADPTTPTYKGGGDISGGTNTGTGSVSFESGTVSGRYLYGVHDGDSTNCSSATGCEFQVWDMSGVEATSVLANSLEAGSLQVQNNANINNNLSIGGGLNVSQNALISGNLGVNGSALFQNLTNSSTAFQVQNSGSAQLLNVDTTNPVSDLTTNSTANLVTNGSFEGSNTTAGWAIDGASVTIAQDSTRKYIGNSSLAITTPASTNRGAKYALTTTTLATNTQYTLTLSARLGGSTSTPNASMSTFDIGRAEDGSTETTCLSGQTINTSGWTTLTCTFTTGTTSSTPYIFVRQSDATARTFYIDGVQLSRAWMLTNYSIEQAVAGNWTAKGTPTTHAQDATQFYIGTKSLKITTQATANQGTQQSITLNDSTTYSLSFYALGSGTALSTMEAGYSSDGSTDNTVCITAQTVSVTVWTGYTCTFTTPSSHSGTPYLYIKNTAATVRTVFLDSIILSTGNGFTAYREGTVSINGIINSPTVFQPQTDSTTAFQIQNTFGGNLFQVDTLNSNITINGNDTGMIQPWQSGTTTGLTARDQYASATGNGYIYIIGGNTTGGVRTATVQYAKVSTNGNVGSWSSAPNLPATLASPAAVLSNGYLYVVGGSTNSANSGAVSTVYYAKVNKDGSLGYWITSANPMNTNGSGTGRWVHTAVAYNGYLYAIGGMNASSNLAPTAYSKLNADGSNGPWTTVTGTLTAQLMSAVVANGYIYAIGVGGTATNYAKINGDGTLSAWNTSTALPVYRAYVGIGVVNGYIYVIGGDNGTSSVASTYYAPLNSDGTIGSWSCQGSSSDCGVAPVNSTALPGARSGLSNTAVSVNGYMYAIGGWNGSAQQATVYYTSTSRIKINGSVDLVGDNGENLAEGSTGGSLTAGNTNIVGNLDVRGTATVGQGLVVGDNLTVNGGGQFKNAVNQANAFQIQNASGVNNLAITTVNQIANTTFETGTLNTDNTVDGWAKKAGTETSIKNQNSNAQFGSNSMEVVTSATVQEGVRYNYSLSPSTQYTFSFYAKVSSGSFATLTFGRSDTGVIGGDTSCVTTGSVSTTYARFSCTFTTGATMGGSGTPYLYITKGTDGSVRTIYIDGVQLEAAASATDYREADIRLDGLTTARSSANSTTAFQIQNASGSNLFQVDTVNSVITLNGNNTGEIQSWTSSTALPAGRAFYGSATSNGYYYVVGGTTTSGGATAANIFYAKLNVDGTMGTWLCQGVSADCGGATISNTNALPVALSDMSVVVANGYMYAIGGYTGSVSVDTIYVAKINSDGSTGAWKSLGDIDTDYKLPQKRNDTMAAVVHGYLYVIGGHNDTITIRTTFVAKLNGDGTLGDGTPATWRCLGNSPTSCGNAPPIDTNDLPVVGRRTSGVTTANGYIYIVGGDNGGALSAVVYTKVNLDGTIAGWTTANSLNNARNGNAAYVANGYLYTVGHFNTGTVEYAPINANGSLGTWVNSSNSLPTGINRGFFGQSGIVVNGYMYVVGGSDNFGAPSTNTYYTSTTRVKVGGSLDLVGISGEDLGESSGSGGTLTAGNTNIVGTLSVNDKATFYQGVSVNNSISVTGSAYIQGAQGSNDMLQVQNADGINIINVNTINAVGNSSFEGGVNTTAPTGWSAKGTGTPTVDTSQALFGTSSMKVVTTTSANGGAKFSYVFGQSTTYTLSLYAKVSSGSITDFVVGRQDTNSTDINCLTGQTLTTTWTRFSCTFTTAAGSGTTFNTSMIYVQKSGGSAETFYIDGVQLEVAGSASDYREADIRLDGQITFKNSADSSSAFQIQNAAATSTLFAVNTSSSIITIAGNTTTFAKLTLNNAHFAVTQTTAPTVATTGTSCNSMTAAIKSGSTDSAGAFSITAGGTPPLNTCTTTITFNKAFGSAPKAIFFTPETQDGGSNNGALGIPFVTSVSTTQATMNFVNAPAASTTYYWYYWIIE